MYAYIQNNVFESYHIVELLKYLRQSAVLPGVCITLMSLFGLVPGEYVEP